MHNRPSLLQLYSISLLSFVILVFSIRIVPHTNCLFFSHISIPFSFLSHDSSAKSLALSPTYTITYTTNIVKIRSQQQSHTIQDDTRNSALYTLTAISRDRCWVRVNGSSSNISPTNICHLGDPERVAFETYSGRNLGGKPGKLDTCSRVVADLAFSRFPSGPDLGDLSGEITTLASKKPENLTRTLGLLRISPFSAPHLDPISAICPEKSPHWRAKTRKT